MQKIDFCGFTLLDPSNLAHLILPAPSRGSMVKHR